MTGPLVITAVWDGLRPDLVTPEVTPVLHGLASEGVWFGASHCVYPSETRVNAAALATGCGPGRSGITANTIYLPAPRHGDGAGLMVNTGDHAQLARLEAADGPLLRAPWVGQALRAAGGAMVVASSGSPGSALLQDPSPDGITVHAALLRPEGVERAVLERCGPPPAGLLPRHRAQRLDHASPPGVPPPGGAPPRPAGGAPGPGPLVAHRPRPHRPQAGPGGPGDGAVPARERRPPGALDGPPGRAGPAGPDGRPAHLGPRLQHRPAPLPVPAGTSTPPSSRRG